MNTEQAQINNTVRTPIPVYIPTSRDLAAAFSKRHDNVVRDIRKAFVDVEETTYIDDSGRQYPQLLLSPDAWDTMVSKYRGKLRMPISAREDLVLKGVELALGYSLERQYIVGKYRIDGYDPHTNTAYEVDEEQHLSNQEADQQRQRHITEKLGCTFKRISIFK